MYELTLTTDERAAFDWVGDRYNTGHMVSSILLDCMGPDEEWDQSGDITFRIPEHLAWQINDLSETEDHLWPCFDGDLREKLRNFTDSIV